MRFGIKRRLASFIGQLVGSNSHLGADLAHNGVDCGPNSGVQRAAVPPRWVVTLPALASRNFVQLMFGIRAPAFFGNAKPQQFSFGINEAGIGL